MGVRLRALCDAGDHLGFASVAKRGPNCGALVAAGRVPHTAEPPSIRAASRALGQSWNTERCGTSVAPLVEPPACLPRENARRATGSRLQPSWLAEASSRWGPAAARRIRTPSG